MKKRILFFAFAIMLAIPALVASAQNHELTEQEDQISGDSCKWASREVSAGWEAVCISTGVGYTCTCGSVKKYY
jgi:hypothetical protein